MPRRQCPESGALTAFATTTEAHCQQHYYETQTHPCQGYVMVGRPSSVGKPVILRYPYRAVICSSPEACQGCHPERSEGSPGISTGLLAAKQVSESAARLLSGALRSKGPRSREQRPLRFAQGRLLESTQRATTPARLGLSREFGSYCWRTRARSQL